MRWLYQIAMVALLPFALLHLAWRGRRQTRGTDAWRERLAHVPVREDAPLWVHAASVGEVQAAVPLIRALLNRAPDLPILITTFTAAGRRRAEEALGDSISYLTAPYDLPWIVSRFLRRVRPRMLLVMETELWLNLFERTHARRIPLVMASARLSERSADRYLRVRGLTRR
ncbi:MAG: glycosyltransferase N-terminal domain-containing protein, partial [Gammaproteobacteria bacterium]